MNTTSYWSDTTTIPQFGSIERNCKVDVAIIGAGITGVTTAYLLKKHGYKVALIERGKVGGFDTTNTTAHLTCVTDTRITELASRFGNDAARSVWDAGRAAIDQIVLNIRREAIDCGFTWIPGFLHAPLDSEGPKEIEALQREASLANDLGFPTEFLRQIPLGNRPGVRFLHQAKFHPVKYVNALAQTIPGDGSRIFEDAEAHEISEKPLGIRVGDHRIRCDYVVVATHNPIAGKAGFLSTTLLQTKLFLYSTYALQARLPSGTLPEASFWDTANPYHYLRIDRVDGGEQAIYGGEDHKTGQEKHTGEAYARLEHSLLRTLPGASIEHRWSGQVIETADGLPYIGEIAENQFVATGFGGNGMTFGTLAAMMALDRLECRGNPWAKLFDVHRKKLSAAWEYTAENKDYPYYFLRDWVARNEGTSFDVLEPDQGRILRINHRKVAAYRDARGKLSVCSPICTHLKCIVEWNEAEKTWDCPCHGSRFAATGEVLSGPAEAPLEKIRVEES